ncbi:protein kinase domain-containing protein [Streptomyces sp. 7N604]|uniref:protein kinase domain-containing protein n=1 Tax=Streptomyces sp. 7N604 TaxID=3457415 RepID=UPI003FD654E9
MVDRAEPSEIFQALEADDPARVGAYELVARLGVGGMGKVYLSYTPAGRPVAIKVIRIELADDSEFRRRFHQEVTAAQRVHGLYTAPVIDSDTEVSQPWLATAFVPGPTLASAVARHGALPVPTVLLLTAGVAEALQAVHAAGLVHRDLKPSNVLLASDGPRVIDFGIARAADATSLTGTGVAVGTPAFMAPEQAAGRELGPATDVFALGQVATYAAKGAPAYGEGSSHAVLYRIVHEEPDLTAVPEALRPLLTRCLAKEPGERPSLAEVVDMCRAASGDSRLRRSEDWLPGIVAADITRHQAVPVQPAAGHPATVPVPPSPAHHAPTMSAVRLDASPLPPQGPPTHPRSAHPAQQVGHPYGGHLPGDAPGMTPPDGMAPGSVAPGNRRQNRGILVAAGVLGTLLLTAGGCAALLNTFDSKDSTTSGQNSAKGGGSTTRATPKLPRPKPVSYPSVQLPDGYHLEFADDPLQPRDSNYDDLYASCDVSWGCTLGSYDTKLVLLNNAEKGSLDTCRATTRYTDRIDQKQLSRGSQICVRTESGHIALLTYKGASAESDPSRYLTFDVKVWRNAVDPT